MWTFEAPSLPRVPWALVERVVAPPSDPDEEPSVEVPALLVPDEEEPMSDGLPALLWAAALRLVPDEKPSVEEPPRDDVPALLRVVAPPVSPAVEVLLFPVDVPS